ncbi:MAG: hypothetical protein HKN03_05165 [Acidimicrobiales bacterium]|nr:hypothetical protein [Acidimicrobiales bacterium]
METQEWQMHTKQDLNLIETQANAMSFAAIGRVLTDQALTLGVSAPSFRSPPRIPGVRRSVTRNRDGSITVSVIVSRRPLSAVVADMIDGIVLTSGLKADEARSLYDKLWTTSHRWLLGDALPARAAPLPGAPTLRAVA